MRNDLVDLGRVATLVLGSYLGTEGFEVKVAERTRVEFAKDGVLLHISYYAEDAPPRGLNVGLGFAYSDGSSEAVGLWALVPAGADTTFRTARFGNETELESILENLLESALRDWAAAYWRHLDRLVGALQDAARLRNEQYQEEVDEKRLHEARAAFEAGRFQEAVDRYAITGRGLTAVDAQRLKVARRKLRSD